ncbi:AAA family ATPase [Puniceicoccus vermicola]|uniref:MoxR family ATPase n=1 Tax=Puniceicoccus vermicola TaxID=388746 RepID=A0A7X1AZX4_9BACT|nr:MoxR family ATPase [Puniceicoccus vermicola]MBC2602008.1 MoxR family ATPase [Puniceicoccus vermicola]
MESSVLDKSRVSWARERLSLLSENIGSVIRGKEEVIEQVLVCVVAGGHLLVEDRPGVGKTTLAYCLARSLDGDFSRIQFTSDLLPSDVLGVSVFDERGREFIFRKGPIFANIVLADEINRTTPKTQSSLLEVMDRSKVSIDGATYEVGRPFMVFATQNPVDFEGTFPLPESQMDRFLMRISMGYVDYDSELEILRDPNLAYDDLRIESVITTEELLEIQKMATQVFLEDSLEHYLLRIVQSTRTEAEFRSGVSTRGLLALKRAVQARAICEGRDFVIPDDVFSTALPVLVHRLVPRKATADAIEERKIVQQILKSIIEEIPAP